MLCQMMVTSKSSCGVNLAFGNSIGEQTGGTTVWYCQGRHNGLEQQSTHTVHICKGLDTLHLVRGRNRGGRNDNLLDLLRNSEAEYCLRVYR
jgi:hypothetical protein